MSNYESQFETRRLAYLEQRNAYYGNGKPDDLKEATDAAFRDWLDTTKIFVGESGGVRPTLHRKQVLTPRG